MNYKEEIQKAGQAYFDALDNRDKFKKKSEKFSDKYFQKGFDPRFPVLISDNEFIYIENTPETEKYFRKMIDEKMNRLNEKAKELKEELILIINNDGEIH